MRSETELTPPAAEGPALPPGGAPAEEKASFKRHLVKGLLFLAFLLAAQTVLFFTPLREVLHHIQEMSDRLQAMGWTAPLLFVPAVALLVLVGVPRLLLCPIGGMAFGFLPGLLWTQAGTIIGFYLTFLFVRWTGRDLFRRRRGAEGRPEPRKTARFFEQGGILAVFLVRQMPLAGFYINILLGFSPVKHRDFLVGTLFGILPEAVPATLIGAGILSVSPQECTRYILAAVAGLVLVWTVLGWYVRTSRSTAAVRIRTAFGGGPAADPPARP